MVTRLVIDLGSVVRRLAPLARLVLGATFLYMGAVKAGSPVEFLKLVRQYHLTENPILLNVLAGTLPWFEILVGLLLIAGIAVRGAGLLAFAMLVPFTLLVAQRAVALHQASGTPFCGLRFDCGCGGGEDWICRKLVENVALIFLAVLVALVRSPGYSIRYALFEEPPKPIDTL